MGWNGICHLQSFNELKQQYNKLGPINFFNYYKNRDTFSGSEDSIKWFHSIMKQIYLEINTPLDKK